MGREIRRVPPHYEHPVHPEKTNRIGMTRYQPQFDQSFDAAARDWKDGLAAWERGERPAYCSDESRRLEFWEWDNGPPDRNYYRTYTDEEATWFQVYETVTEGTPITPAFETEAELIEHLVAHGTWLDEYERRAGWKAGPCGWPRETAKRFVRFKYAPSMIIEGERVKTVFDPDFYPSAPETGEAG